VFALKHCINGRKTTKVVYALNLSEQSYKMLQGENRSLSCSVIKGYLEESGLLYLMHVEYDIYNWHQQEQAIKMG
jgi:hypothetical protein